MSDNLKLLIDQVNDVIDPTADIGDILASEHNVLEKNVIAMLGRYSGFPFLAKRSPTDGKVPAGNLYWNGNAMNKNNADFFISISDLTVDANKFGRIIALMTENDIVKIKDFIGRSVTLKFISSTEMTDPDGLKYHDVLVRGFAENTIYAYQPSDDWPCILEFIRAAQTPAASFNDFDQRYEFDDADESPYDFEVEPNMINVSVKIADGNFLTKDIGYTYAGSTISIIDDAQDLLENGTPINIKGIYQ